MTLALSLNLRFLRVGKINLSKKRKIESRMLLNNQKLRLMSNLLRPNWDGKKN
jgi:hypothetical protein